MPTVNRVAVVTLLAITCVFPSATSANDWPGFHGLSHAGVVADASIPKSFGSQQPSWTFDLQTRDVGSIAIQNGQVYVLAMVKGQPTIRLHAIDLASGQSRWSKDFPQSDNHLHSRNTLASSTPATDAEFVYFANSDREHTWLRCLDHDGNEQWTRDFGPAQSQHGFGTSPTVVGEKVLLNFSQQHDQVRRGTPGTSKVIALDRKTGATIWETPVTSTRVCYGVPAVVNNQVIGANTGDGIYSLSLQTGEMLWRLPVFKMRCVSSPIIVGNLAIGSSGSGGGGNHMVAVKMPNQAGEQPSEAYRVEKYAPYVPTAVVKDDLMFIVDDKGIASCIDAQTGESKWTKRIGGNFGASPILLGNDVLIISLDGEATVFKASPKFQKVTALDLGGPVGATPAYANGKLIIRVGTELRCF
ncbi:outer membrane protein assembly factor BamB family protein [Roseiconus lacunae]|uniref:PQQ-binding-like beta-propeller repeat protein n=1 Tax=Roseiconus lacunae TaxID=2605694 RepID=A0ABT7PFG6_9BACT|nr:PQQ-binding-like beta-propeller repeat protein [Roseiconus lacunae]MCD0462246.1 PQQ-like beta-propeller repeat protein [Roseiconus lacunae]MDM4015049.1 PQQ-binding-like beta-propeller repeat protein [Roseiconus lacunae]